MKRTADNSESDNSLVPNPKRIKPDSNDGVESFQLSEARLISGTSLGKGKSLSLTPDTKNSKKKSRTYHSPRASKFKPRTNS